MNKEEYIPTPIRFLQSQYQRLRKESFATGISQAEIVRRALDEHWARQDEEAINEKRFFIVNPDSESYDEKFFAETVEYLSGEFDVEADWTGKTRDSGYGQEKEFLLKGKREDVELFVSRLEDACHI